MWHVSVDTLCVRLCVCVFLFRIQEFEGTNVCLLIIPRFQLFKNAVGKIRCCENNRKRWVTEAWLNTCTRTNTQYVIFCWCEERRGLSLASLSDCGVCGVSEHPNYDGCIMSAVFHFPLVTIMFLSLLASRSREKKNHRWKLKHQQWIWPPSCLDEALRLPATVMPK